MGFCEEISRFVTEKIGGIVIIESDSGKIAFADDFFTGKYGGDIVGQRAEEVFDWLEDCPKLEAGNPATEWEKIDIFSKKYYRFNSGAFLKDEKLYYIHQISDITEYMGLNRDITKYMSFFKKLSGFQTAVLEKLSDSYLELLPMITDYFKAGTSIFFVQRDKYIEIVTFTQKGKVFTNDRIPMPDDTGALFGLKPGEDIHISDFAEAVKAVLMISGASENNSYSLLCSGDVSGQSFSVFLEAGQKLDRDSMAESALVSVIKLYAENALMRDKLIYENEHDHLTGLYNKGKYLERIEKDYPYRDSIAIFNFDVNNLKKMNDMYGHEAGDKLIIKGADSIRKVTSASVHGYRMGGDEFLMVACDVTKEEAETLKARWEKELARLNTLDDGINCVIAVGMTFGNAPYDLKKLLSEADALMYEDKKSKKKPGEEIR